SRSARRRAEFMVSSHQLLFAISQDPSTSPMSCPPDDCASIAPGELLFSGSRDDGGEGADDDGCDSVAGAPRTRSGSWTFFSAPSGLSMAHPGSNAISTMASNRYRATWATVIAQGRLSVRWKERLQRSECARRHNLH